MSSLQTWEFKRWANTALSQLLPLNEAETDQIVTHTLTLSDLQAGQHLQELLGDSPEAVSFMGEFMEKRSAIKDEALVDVKGSGEKQTPEYMPPPYAPPGAGSSGPKATPQKTMDRPAPATHATSNSTAVVNYHHSNAVIEAGKVRARDEVRFSCVTRYEQLRLTPLQQEMQQMLQNLQYQYRIYNSEIDPEHDTDYYCGCPIHQYKMAKYRRYGVQEMWSKAVMYPGKCSKIDNDRTGIFPSTDNCEGEHSYNDNTLNGSTIFSRNPYQFRVNSPYGYNAFSNNWGGISRPIPSSHARSIHQTIALNNSLNRDAQASIDGKEPKHSIWEEDVLETAMSNLEVGDRKKSLANLGQPAQGDKSTGEKRQSIAAPAQENLSVERPKASKLSSFRKSIGIKSSEERAVTKLTKAVDKGNNLRDDIVAEEQARWPDGQWRFLVANYQEKVGMNNMIANLRAQKPIQYLHLLRAGFFEPIPVAWANQASNPLKFSIEAGAGWRGITPAWRGYEDTAEERLYWVLNHREGSAGTRLKPDFISELNMARERMARAVEPPPLYFAADDTCHLQHTSEGYSKQVMPPPFRAFDRPEVPSDDTMILLDVSGSMDFDPVRPKYDQYLITGYAPSTQPKNKGMLSM